MGRLALLGICLERLHRSRKPFQMGLFGIGIPQVPSIDLAPDVVDDHRRDCDADARFDVHEWGDYQSAAIID
ncbi:hypothetical protein A9973_18820 [Achromobacter sp. UMC46]|nr:hypothetical protein [Achromobacter sp. UMC46]